MKKWSQDKVGLLKNNYNKLSLAELSIILDFSKRSIIEKCKKLKLSRKLTKEKIICLNCKIETISKKFCSSKCSAIYNNKNRVAKNHRKECLKCGKKSLKPYCNLKCAGLPSLKERNYKKYLENPELYNKESWSPSSYKCFIFAEQDNKCAICNINNIWNNNNLTFILDHIDGNSANNNRSNIRLVCPNCDTQLPTYKSKNKGNGRYFRRKRRDEGKSF